MELSDYLRVFRAHWLGFVASIVVGCAAASLFTLTQPVVFAADASGFVGTPGSTDSAMASVNDSLAKSRSKSYVDIALSRATAQRVIDELDLGVEPASLIGNISVQLPLDTVLIKITARASSPLEAQKLADAWVKALAAQVEEIENPSGVQGGAPTQIVPVESASLPSSPVSPRPRLNLMIGFGLGVLLGVAHALVRNQLDRRLRTGSDVEKEAGVAVVGQVPVSRTTDSTAQRRELVALRGAGMRGSEGAEAFRKLRTNLAFMDVDHPPRMIVVTSPHQGDGKSTVAANLAAAIAASGEPVTLVDGDLRRPTVADSFGLVEGAGLTDVLIGTVTVDEVLQAHGDLPNFSVLAAGSIPPNPSELLGSKAMSGVLQKLVERGMVIVDAPPLLPVTDAAVLSARCDGSLIVVSYGKTLDSELKDAMAHIQAVNGRVLGVIFNRVPRRNTAGGYYGDYYRSSAQAQGQHGAGNRERTIVDQLLRR